MRKTVDLKIAYRLINHGPLVLVSSIFDNRVDVTPIAWNMPVSDDPPIVALEVWEGHFIYKAIMQTKDFVINVPSGEMADIVRGLGSVSGAKADKVKKFGLAMEKSERVNSPRLKDAIGVMECRLHRDKRLVEKYNIILGDVVYAEAREDAFTDRWLVEKGEVKTLHHLGNRIFCVPDSKIV